MKPSNRDLGRREAMKNTPGMRIGWLPQTNGRVTVHCASGRALAPKAQNKPAQGEALGTHADKVQPQGGVTRN